MRIDQVPPSKESSRAAAKFESWVCESFKIQFGDRSKAAIERLRHDLDFANSLRKPDLSYVKELTDGQVRWLCGRWRT